jgi:hypothetical protein
LDDPRRKAVAAVGYFSHRARLPLGRASGLSGYPDKANLLVRSEQKKNIRHGERAKTVTSEHARSMSSSRWVDWITELIRAE